MKRGLKVGWTGLLHAALLPGSDPLTFAKAIPSAKYHTLKFMSAARYDITIKKYSSQCIVSYIYIQNN
jgi:hypothetical protein